MIKAEIEVEDDNIFIDGKLVNFVMGVNEDYWQIEDIAEIFSSLEQAIAYCLEQPK